MEEDILKAQRNEITEHYFYSRISKAVKDSANRSVIEKIAQDELRHFEFWKRHSGREIKPDPFKLFFYLLLFRIFGITFVVKLMEKQEKKAQINYERLSRLVPQALEMERDEEEHEEALVMMIDEERLKYMGSIVLGLNDALVELTGALAGLTFAFGKTTLIAATGFITGIAASFSMAASEYLSQRIEKGSGTTHPLKSALYTFIAYVLTVLALILPFLLISHPYIALGVSLALSVLVIGVFTYYSSITQDSSFKKRFLEMVSISLGIAGLSFGLGVLVRSIFGIDI
ncbi:MAG: VIT1/CCC1 transporter family protein [Caldiserica bacterium]|jgi:VIT1/CCC1 family predicted Fe2+/Mn2+ transporter|nr:VIT1/CCC1 transporter family protein [Caldisericota bacterium]MDH7562648.1 VIT1/CCC1 transporter family protein [Caldisericota bacterium]